MGYFLFILVNAALFIRPGDLLPELQTAPVYEDLIVACLLVSLPHVLDQMLGRSLVERPITVCVVGLWAVVVLSHLSASASPGGDEMPGIEFFKVLLYYLLLVGLINSPVRLQRFLRWLVGFTAVLTVLALFQYYAHEPAPRAPAERTPSAEGAEKAHQGPQAAAVDTEVRDEKTGQVVVYRRLRSTGIFNDPNDLSTILVVAIMITLYLLSGPRGGIWSHLWLTLLGFFGIALVVTNSRVGVGALLAGLVVLLVLVVSAFNLYLLSGQRGGFGHPLWLVLLALFGYALVLTYSRGGLIALLAGLVVFLGARFGWKKTMPLALLALPALGLFFAGRQTEISLSKGTGQSRIQLWGEGLYFFRHSPLFGIGVGEYARAAGQVAHNSFIHAFAELGFLGGMLFLGAFYHALRTLHRLGSRQVPIQDPELQRLRPYLLGTVAGYTTGMMSLSRCYILPTYMILGLVTAYLRIAVGSPTLPEMRFDARLARRFAAASVVFLGVMYVFVRVFVHWK